MNAKLKARLWTFWRGWCAPILVVLVVLGSFRSAVADWNDVPTGSMKPTILEGDRIFVNKLAYDLKVPFTLHRLARWSDPVRGDVVILFSPESGDRLVKRVIGVPGDQIAMYNNRLYINGAAAAYEPLDQDTIDQIEVGERTKHKFAAETLDDVRHAVMTTPPVAARRSFEPMTLAVDQYFVMGDNRDNSKDSRYFGTADRSQIVGRVGTVVLSFDRDRYYMPRWDRFFRDIP